MTTPRGLPIQRAPLGFTIAALGDSITRLNSGTYNRADSFIDYAVLLSGGRLVSVGNFGVPGQKATDMVGRVSQALAPKPAFLNVLAGTNDINQGVQAGLTAQQIARSASRALKAIYDAAVAAGTTPVANTVPPYGYSTGLTDPRKIANEVLNNWIRRHAALNGYPLVDHYLNLVDPGSINGSSSSAPGNWKYPALTYTSDGVHPTAYAAGLMGQSLFNTLSPLLPPNPFMQPMVSLVDSAQSVFTVKNPFFKNQATYPGVYPDNANTLGASVSNTTGVTYSMVTDSGVGGFALNIALSTSATQSGGIAPQSSSEVFNAGDIAQVCGVFSTDGGTSTTVQVVSGGTTYKLVNIAKGTAVTHGVYFAEFPVPNTGTLAVQMLTGNPVSGTAANIKFWYPKVLNATKHLGVATALTRD